MRVLHPAMAAVVILSALSGSAQPAPPDQQTARPSVTGPTMEGCILTLSTDKTKYIAGELITLTATIKNISDHDIFMPDYTAPLSYEIKVMSPEATEAPKSLYYKRQQHAQRLSFRSFVLKPGQQATESFNLGRLFDMSLEGIYTVSVRRIVGKNGGMGDIAMVPSNSVKISVRGEDDDKFYQPVITPK